MTGLSLAAVKALPALSDTCAPTGGGVALGSEPSLTGATTFCCL
jgi:hypothetical protein